MEITLYQINPDRDYEDYEFKHFDFAEDHGIDPYIYDRVWSGHLEAESLSDAYMILNGEIMPDNYLGRAMSQSDICEVHGEDGQSKFFYVDDILDYKEIEFDSSLTREAKEREISVLRCQPGKTAEVVKIPNTLKSLQSEVGGYIECVYPSSDPIALIVNEEGKIHGLPLNRALYTEDGEQFDIACGNLLIVGLTEDDFGSLRGDLLEKYYEKFKQPEHFMKFGNQIMAFKYPEQKKDERHKNHHIRR